jgi:hypothetical protein
MMNWKGYGRKQLWTNLRYYLGILPGGTEENHKEPQSGLPVCRPRSESGTFRLRSRSTNRMAATFGGIYRNMHKRAFITIHFIY